MRTLEELHRLGFAAVGAENPVFAKDREDAAEVFLGGTVHGLECQNVSQRGGACRLAIDWELLDIHVKATDLNVVDVNGGGVDDLSVTLSDDSLELFIGGTSNGLSSAVKQTSPLIIGDITLDACVDPKDWQILSDNYGYPVTAGTAARADLNGDGWVDYFDYLELVQHWEEGSGCP